ncbi:MAG: shikimate dehydrogenase [Flavobacteriaceae bacterium]|nr:shikimate dehydrogenase [Flavobacteriaceae bacterium]
MESIERGHRQFGLLGKNIDYSFSRAYFSKKFEQEGVENTSYINFDVDHIDQLELLLQQYKETLVGFNVTIPYKQEVFKYLNEVDPHASAIGAVNTVKVTSNGLMGFNTDYLGFRMSLKPCLKTYHQKALILGTGGAAKAVAYALKDMGIEIVYVSRNPDKDGISYINLRSDLQWMQEHLLVINATPLGTYPNIDNCPDIPYDRIGEQHLFYDLIYNPSETKFLKLAAKKGASTINGEAMLRLQAEAAWQIWNL